MFLLFLEGYLSLSTEIIILRQLTPFSGTNVLVSSLVIGFFLLALAIGYLKGGKVAANYEVKITNNFMIILLLYSIGLSYAYIEFHYYLLETKLGLTNLQALLAYILAIICPLTYFFGQTIPLVIGAYKNTGSHSYSYITGQALHFNTLGSFLGAILTSVVFFNTIGVAHTINIGILIILIILGYFLLRINNTTQSKIIFSSIFLMAILLIKFNANFEKNRFLETNVYANYEVITDIAPYKKILLSNNSLSSSLTNDLNGFPYIQKIRAILFDELKLKNRQIAVLGAGGFTLTALSNYENHVTYVDIDQNLPKLVKKHFLPDINGNFVNQDARTFISQYEDYYDAIVVDTYSNQQTIPPHLVTQEFYEKIDQALKKDGVAIFNIIANPRLLDPFSLTIYNTLQASFENCLSNPLQYSNATTNIIFICHKKRIESQKKQVYSDNFNRSSLEISLKPPIK